jgi:hypothetical protein
LEREFPVVNLCDDDVAKFLSKCEEILDEVMESDLGTELKSFLVVRLDEMCTALRHYKISGTEGLQKVIEANIGGLILKSSKIPPKEKESPLWKKYVNFLGILVSAVGVAANVTTVIDSSSINDLLLPPGNTHDQTNLVVDNHSHRP